MQQRHSVLIVDDQRENLFVLKEILAEYLPELDVVAAMGASDAMRLVTPSTSVVLSDVQMPGISGVELCAQLKSMPSFAHIPFLLITSHQSTPSLRIKGLEAGALDFISRPINTEELVAKIQIALDVHSARNRLQEEKDRLQKHLVLAETQYKKLFENATDAIFITDESLHVIDANRECLQLIGYSFSEMKGRTVDSLIPQNSPNIRLYAFETPEAPITETSFVRKDGVRVDVEVRSRLVDLDDSSVRWVIARDVTLRKRTESMLREKEASLSRAQAIAHLGNWELHIATGRMVWSDELYRIFGFEAGGVEPSADLLVRSMHPEDRAGVGSLAQWLTARDKQEFKFRLDRPKGEERWVRGQSETRFDASGKPEKIFGVLMDVTEEHLSQTRLEQALAKAEAANKAKSEFLANMSHEIRTPLNGIMGMLQVIKGTTTDDAQKEYVAMALQSSQRLNNLLSDILDLSMVEARKLNVVSEPFELAAVLQQVSELLTPAANQAELSLRFILDPETPKIVYSDPSRIAQILTNLLGNALKFTASGGVTVEASYASAREPGQGSLIFNVEDTGVGIPREEIASLFEPFTQLQHGYTHKKQGAGLGLSICSRLIQLMHGAMCISSEPGAGTQVYFSVQAKAAQFPRSDDAEACRPSLFAAGSKKVLVADDDEVSGVFLRRMLEHEGIAVHVAPNGKLALDALKKETYDAVLMDVQMPEMDGVRTTKAIRCGEAGEAAKSVPIIALTAYVMRSDKEKFLEAGMDGYLSKPVLIDAVKEALHSVLFPEQCRGRK